MISARKWLSILAFLALGLALTVCPQGPAAAQEEEPVGVAVTVPVLDGYPPGETYPVVILLNLEPGVQVLAPEHEKGGPECLKLTLEGAEGFTAGKVSVPKPPMDKLFRDRGVVTAELSVDSGVAPGMHDLKGKLCVAVYEKGESKNREMDLDIPVNVLKPGLAPRLASPAMMSQMGVKIDLDRPGRGQGGGPGMGRGQGQGPGAGQGMGRDRQLATVADAAPAVPEASGAEEDPFANQSLFWVLGLVFLGGLALNLTPCVYPLIPITISIFGGQQDTFRRAGAIGSALAYWAGMVVTYTALGSFVSLTGNMLGAALSHPAVIVVIVGILLAMAASMFGLWEIRLPASINRVASQNKAGILGAFFMGLMIGILAAPCVGPFVVGLMTHVAEKHNILYGVAVFFCLSLGLGLPMAVLAAFSETLTSKLPRAGGWMIWIRAMFGSILLIMAVGMARPLLGEAVTNWMVTGTAVLAGIYLGFIDKNGAGKFVIFKRLFGVLALVGAGAFFYITSPGNLGKVPWVPFEPKVLAEAVEAKKPAIVDFTADWCPPCRKLVLHTFTDNRVVEAMKAFVPVKVDVTSDPGPDAKALAKELRVRGVPTIIFMDTGGRAIPELTLVGFEPPEKFLERIQRAKDHMKMK